MVSGLSVFRSGKNLLFPFADILHVNMAADASFYRKKVFIDTAHFFGKKIIIHEHGGDFQGFYYERCNEKQRAKVRNTLDKAEVFLVLSDTWKQFFSELLSESKIEVFENGVEIPKKTKVDYSSHKVVFLGRLCKEKGIEELLNAVPEIVKEVPDFQLILGGIWEPGNDLLQKKAEELKDTILTPGWITAKERTVLFEECSIFVLPTWFEGQPISLLEAMAAGMCVVASEVGGIPQIMGEDLATGVYLKPKDEHALARKLIWILQEEELREKLGKSARERMKEKYDIVQKTEQLVAYYKEICL